MRQRITLVSYTQLERQPTRIYRPSPLGRACGGNQHIRVKLVVRHSNHEG